MTFLRLEFAGTIPSAGFSSRAEAVASSVKASFREAVDALTPKDAPWKVTLVMLGRKPLGF